MATLTYDPPTPPVNLGTGAGTAPVNLGTGSGTTPVNLTPGAPTSPVGLTTDIGNSNPALIGPDAYTTPYYNEEEPDGSYHYYSWQHVDGLRWRAQRIDRLTSDIDTVFGMNPQPDDLADFQGLSW